MSLHLGRAPIFSGATQRYDGFSPSDQLGSSVVLISDLDGDSGAELVLLHQHLMPIPMRPMGFSEEFMASHLQTDLLSSHLG